MQSLSGGAQNMEEEDKSLRLETELEQLRCQLQVAQQESHSRKVELKRDRAFLGDELQRVRDKVVVTSEEKERYERKLEGMRKQIKQLQEEAAQRNQAAQASSNQNADDSSPAQAELQALQSELDAIRRVWVVQDEQWSPGTLVEVTSNDSAMVLSQDGTTTEHAIADLMGSNLLLDSGCIANLADLGEDGLKEPVIVETLLQNKSKQLPFTFVGSVLLCLSDNTVLPACGPQARTGYRCCNHTGELPPHVFSVLETAYRSMRLERDSQSVVLSGTAGAGKSMLFRWSLEYLVLDRHVGNVHKILDGLTVLESFGCAQTAHNRCSSRLSTLVEVQYDIAGTAIGASTAIYGLEKTRLTEKKDFNFAVFYQMCSGATEGEKKTLHLKSAAEFPYLNPGANSEENRRITNACGVNYDSTGDTDRYRHLKNAMNNMGLDSVMRAAIFRVLAAILWLGKLEFVPVNPRQAKPILRDRTVLDKAAHLLRCSAADLERALTDNTEQGNDLSAMNENAAYARDVLAQALYTRVFNWIVERLNALLTQDDAFSVISVLDLVSFEATEEDNTFDNFYRNYATECVENLFNRDFFEVEEEEYTQEKLRLPSFEFPSNRGCIDLIDRQGGFIAMLDQECQFAKGNEVALLRRLNGAFERDEYYSRSRSKKGFNIKHWEQEVHYTSTGMIERNQDLMPACVLDLMDQCKCRFLAELFPSDNNAMRRPVTLLAQLKSQMAALLRPLSSPSGSTPYYVRCLRSNKLGTDTDEPDSGYMLKQLRAFRVPQMLQLRNLGFPVRSSFVDFYNRYRIFSEQVLVDRAESMYKQQCEFVLASMDFDRGSYQTGTTKVYLKETQLKLLEQKRHDLRERAALKVQKHFRTCRFLARFRAWRRHTALVAPVVRGILARQHYQQRKESLAMAEAEAESNIYNKYVREQIMQAQEELTRMREAFKENEEWNIEWRRQRVENARETAQNMFEKASQKMAEMDALLIRDFRAPDDIGQSTIIIPHEEIAAAVHKVVQEGNEDAIREHKRQVQEREDERKVRMALAREEAHLKEVEEALKRRKWAHPLQELAWMRAEEQMQRIAAIVNATRDLDHRLESEQHSVDSAYESHGYSGYEKTRKKLERENYGGGDDGADEPAAAPQDPNAWFGDGPVGEDANSLLAAMCRLPEGLVSAEFARLQAGEEVRFDPERPPQPSQVFQVVELDEESEEEAEVYEVDEVPEEEKFADHNDEYYQSLEFDQAANAEGTEDTEGVEAEEGAEPAEGGPMVPEPPDFVPGVSSQSPNADQSSKSAEQLTVEGIIDQRRQKRKEANDPDVDMDTIFAEIDNELANIKHMYFDTCSSSTKYEFTGKEEEPELDYKYRFKYKFRGVDAGLTDQDLQSLV
eukprot:TRINITY_DN6821_c0_g3_i2.p1 TRINITY_DN6821_c0_g3~~TRINITY_DN6821_c0_g3_i2.p1  ORF type:complete len:1378 (+),score=437.42 TRINITY_DN6821_c0_g3_i2:265-4398(+)